MKLEYYRCAFCGCGFPLVPIACVCPECGLRHFFVVDRDSCENELFIPDIQCPREKIRKKKGPSLMKKRRRKK